MATVETVGEMLVEAGPALPDIEGVLRRGVDEWLVRFPDIDVAAEFDADTDRLVLSADLETPRPEHRLTVYAAMLNYALLWRDTGGVAVALDADGGLVLLLTLYGGELTAELLATVLANFTGKARILRTYVAQGGEEPTAGDVLATTMLRI